MKKFTQLVVLAFCLGAFGTSQASLLGTNVTATNIFQGTVFEGPTNVTVTGGIELTNFGGLWDIDIGGDSILFTFAQNPSFSGIGNGLIDEYLFTELDWGLTPGLLVGAIIENELLNSATVSISGVTPTSLLVEFTGLPGFFNAGDFVLVGLQVEHDVQNVPEPTTFALLGLGLASFGFKRRGQLSSNMAAPPC